MHNIEKHKKYITVTIFLIFLGFATILIKNTAIYPYGDGVDYILQTESFYNHFTPDLKLEDIKKYQAFNKKYKSEFYKEEVYSSIQDLFNSDVKFFDERNGFYKAKNGKIYSYHFWLYSLANLPVRTVLGLLHLDITYTFIITNYLILLLGIIIIFCSINLSYINKIWTSLFLVFSPVLWYMHWSHPEVFSSVLVFSSLILFFDKRFYIAMFLMSMASTHFPPLFIPVAIMLIYTLKEEKITLKSLVLSFLSCLFVILPTIFYYYNYSIPNLIIEAGFISTKYITLNRLHSFFLDVNQGMILGLPLILIFSTILFTIRVIKRKIKGNELLFFSVFLMSYFYLQMGNWNHGMSVVNRYVVWNAMFILYYFLMIFIEKKWKLNQLFFTLILISQIIVVVYFINIKEINWQSTQHNKIATWVLDKYPNWYNPDPHIFQVRTNKGSLSYTDSVITYNRPDSTITKMMIYKGNHIYQLLDRGISKEKIEEFLNTKNYYLDWIYINKKDLDKMGYIQSKDTLINYIENSTSLKRRMELREFILNNTPYVELIKNKAKDWNMSFNETLELDIDYILSEEKNRIYKRD